MASTLDQLTAILVAGVVLLMLLSGGQRASADSVGAASYYALRKQTESFGETVRRDLTALSRPVSTGVTAGSFSFYARLTPLDDTEALVRYRLVDVGLRDGVMLQQIERTVDGVPSGASPKTVTSWSIRGETETGAAAASAGTVSQVHVDIELALPFVPPPAEGETLPERTRWEATVVPLVLHASTL